MTGRERVSAFIDRLMDAKIPFVTILLLTTVLFDVLFIGGSSDLRFFGLLGVYGFHIWRYHVKSKATFLWTLGLLAIMFLLFLFEGTSERTEESAVWLVLFMLVGIIQQWRE